MSTTNNNGTVATASTNPSQQTAGSSSGGPSGQTGRSSTTTTTTNNPNNNNNNSNSNTSTGKATPDRPRRRSSTGSTASKKRGASKSKARPSSKRPRGSQQPLPPVVRSEFPASQVYTDLVEFERKFDAQAAARKASVEALVAKSVHEIPITLRMFMMNEVINNPDVPDCKQVPGAPPSWTFQIVGKIVGWKSISGTSTKAEPKLTSFFNKVIVSIPSDIPDTPPDIIEWNKDLAVQATDALQITRAGTRPTTLTVAIQLDFNPPRWQIPDEAMQLLGLESNLVVMRDLISAVWCYIKVHSLQDAHDKKVIICDAAFRRLFHVQEIPVSSLVQTINTLCRTPDPLTFEYNVMMEADTAATEVCYHVHTRMIDPSTVSTAEVLDRLTKAKEITALEEKIAATVYDIYTHKDRRQFFRRFAADPANFMRQVIASQTADEDLFRSLPSVRTVFGLLAHDAQWRRSSLFDSQLQLGAGVDNYLTVTQKKLEDEKKERLTKLRDQQQQQQQQQE